MSSKYKNLISKIILISGPTASGKSKYAIKIAKRLNGEIVNADSMQIYKEIRVLNARPNKVYTKNIKHHLYGFHSVKKNFSTGKWLILAEQVIKKIIKKNKIPIVVGGTGLYFKALNYGLAKIPKVPKVIRNNIIKEQKKIGQKKFYKKLIKVDPIAKEKINQNDSQRSIRAYEVKKFTKKSIFEWFKKTKKIFPNDKFIKIYIDYPRLNLIKKIDLRIIRMLRSGAISEVKHFKKLRVSKDFTSNKIIGILEISEYLRRILRLQEAKDKISIKTKQYAKRQATWARGHMKDWHKVNDLKLKSFIKILNSYL